MNDYIERKENEEIKEPEPEEAKKFELEEHFNEVYDRGGKKTGCFLKGCIGGFITVSLVLIAGGLYIYFTEYETMGIVCAVVGLLCFLFFFGAFVILPFYQWKKFITPETQRAWKEGELTRSEIIADTGKSLRTKKIGFFIAFAFCVAFGAISFIFVESIIYPIALFGCGVYCLILFIKENKKYKSLSGFYIVEDKVTDSGTDTRFDVVDALTTHLPDRVPYLVFEKYGKYDIDLNQIHKYYMAHELEKEIESGETVYLVCSAVDNGILHIYRAKYRTLAGELLPLVMR